MCLRLSRKLRNKKNKKQHYCVQWVQRAVEIQRPPDQEEEETKRKNKTSASFIVFKELHNALITVKTNRLSPHVIVQAYN